MTTFIDQPQEETDLALHPERQGDSLSSSSLLFLQRSEMLTGKVAAVGITNWFLVLVHRM